MHVQINAEVVVTFEGTTGGIPASLLMLHVFPVPILHGSIGADQAHMFSTHDMWSTFAEMGNPFMARQSYLPSEIHWGHQFCPIIRKPKPPSTRYLIEIERCSSNPSLRSASYPSYPFSLPAIATVLCSKSKP